MHEKSEEDQETSMPAQSRTVVQDEFQVEVNRMRNSLSALALKHFMFEAGSKEGGGEIKAVKAFEVKLQEPQVAVLMTEDPIEASQQQQKEAPKEQPPEVPKDAIDVDSQQSEIMFRRSLSKHRQEPNRTHSKHIDPSDIIAALTASKERLDERKRVEFEKSLKAEPKKVHVNFPQDPKVELKTVKLSQEPKSVAFDEFPSFKRKVFMKEPSRDSDEVATINNELPWQKKHEYRTVTPFFRQTSKQKTLSQEIVTENVAFRPIETSRSSEDINQEILKPVPIFLSSSFQELPRKWEFKPFDEFQTKSNDDLLFSNIDGVRKPESKRHKLVRIRSTSNSSLNRLSDQLVYENFHFDIPEVSTSMENVTMRKPPRPLPRVVDENTKRQSKTIVYVLDKESDEFVLEEGDEDTYEDVLLRNNVDRNSDDTSFYSLLDSRDDCKFAFCTLEAAGVFNVQCNLSWSWS